MQANEKDRKLANRLKAEQRMKELAEE